MAKGISWTLASLLSLRKECNCGLGFSIFNEQASELEQVLKIENGGQILYKHWVHGTVGRAWYGVHVNITAELISNNNNCFLLSGSIKKQAKV